MGLAFFTKNIFVIKLFLEVGEYVDGYDFPLPKLEIVYPECSRLRSGAVERKLVCNNLLLQTINEPSKKYRNLVRHAGHFDAE